MSVLPNLLHGSTTFSNRITSYDLLAQRVRRMLGEPLIQVEVSNEQMYEIIDNACEYFTKFAGTTEEFLIFKSDLYIPQVGLPIGRLINITPDLKSSPNPDSTVYPIDYKNTSPMADREYVSVIGDGINNTFNVVHNLETSNLIVQVYDNVNKEIVFPGIVLVDDNICEIHFNYVPPVSSFKAVIISGSPSNSYNTLLGDGSSKIYQVNHNLNSLDVIVQAYDTDSGEIVYTTIVNDTPNRSTIVFEDPLPVNSIKAVIRVVGNVDPIHPIYAQTHSAGWDYDLNNYRKVIDVTSFEQGSNTGVNTLFTIEHTIAQQAYFGHLLGNVGYDLITWQALKGWLDLREKVLALTPYLRFNPDTQMLRIIPEPSQNNVYYGLVRCKLQKPIKDIVSQLWVYRYTLALTKILVGHVRGKFQGTNLYGGQTVNGADLMSQGMTEKEKLEQEITSDLIDRDPIAFFIG